MSFRAANKSYEDWLRTQCDVVEADLDYKHQRMAKDPFKFLRATFFRWAATIEEVCPGDVSKDAPAVLSVGDTHTENFGTWRDGEGRLVWGINDFDEAAVIPYPFDLVRLAASVRLAGRGASSEADARAIASGYGKGLDQPRPTLLDERATWMRPLVACNDDDRRKFWKEVEGYPAATPPGCVKEGLQLSLPAGAVIDRFAARRKGGGSLGRPRFVAVATWRGGKVVREAKAWVPSAWDWVHDKEKAKRSSVIDLATGTYRSPDPFLRIHAGFIVRRVAADSRKVELGDDPGDRLNSQLLEAMGFDLGSIHAASEHQTRAIRSHFEGLRPDWLERAAKAAAASVKEDYASWAK